MTARAAYRQAWQYVRLFAQEDTDGAFPWPCDYRNLRAIPVAYRRAAARSYNARRYARTVYFVGQETRRRHDPTWLPF